MPDTVVSSWGHAADSALPVPAPDGTAVDPRVERTQRHVLEHARRLLLDQGALRFSFSVLAERARVSRQTLYRYWDGPDALVADLVVRRVGVPVQPSPDARTALVCWLRGLRAVLSDPATSVAYGMLVATAPHSAAADRALAHVLATRLTALNDRLDGLHPPLAPDDLAQLCGPVVYAQLVARSSASDQLIDETVDSFLAAPSG